ncbi:MAG: hypothetical protein Q9223_006641 [Gallowayella weberi]
MDTSKDPDDGDGFHEKGAENVQSSGQSAYPDPETIMAYSLQGSLCVGTTELREQDVSPHSQRRSFSGSPEESDPERVGSDDIAAQVVEGLYTDPHLTQGDDHGSDSAFELSKGEQTDTSLSDLSHPSDHKRLATQNLTRRGGGRVRGRARGRGTESGPSRGKLSRRSQKGVKRGHRKPLEPSNEFKSLHAQATMAFIDADYETAAQLTLQAILLNPEMFAAHSLLSEIHTARGDYDKALTALFNGAHTSPRDPEPWFTISRLILARSDDNDNSALRDALYCYNRILAIDGHNLEALNQRAPLRRKLGYKQRAADDYENLLRLCPHDVDVLRSLAAIYLEMDNPHRALEHYDKSILYFQSTKSMRETNFSWSDVNIYVELFAYQQRYEEAIFHLKSLSRWLLGRQDDTLWENFRSDDREWDLDDHPRRTNVRGFRADSYPVASYGKGLPLELHIKLGIYRLRSPDRQVEEALRKFECLDPEDSSTKAMLVDYSDLFRDVADALRDTGLYDEALRYYEPLQRIPGSVDISYYADIAVCYKAVGLGTEAEECHRIIADLEQQADKPEEGGPRQRTRHRDLNKEFHAKLKGEKNRSLYDRTQELLGQAREDNAEALGQWMATAQELVDDFRSHRAFFPSDKGLRVYERPQGGDNHENDPAIAAGDYHVLAARSHNVAKAYEILKIADGANVFYCSPESMFLVHVCWFTCALMVSDQGTSCGVARWFMKEFQFITDGYRLFSALNRLCNGNNAWYNCGPSQKYVLRQLKAMDHSLVGQGQHNKWFQERASYTTRDNEGNAIKAGEIDLALVMLYGYILYLGRSYSAALNYFFRAYALAPRNPIINLSLALAYVQHAVKRQSDNRHYLITQALTFLFRYHELRVKSQVTSEQQEAKYNVGRTYHMLGLTHLAIPYYERCIALTTNRRRARAAQWEDFTIEAAFALRNIWAADEQMTKALHIGVKISLPSQAPSHGSGPSLHSAKAIKTSKGP